VARSGGGGRAAGNDAREAGTGWGGLLIGRTACPGLVSDLLQESDEGGIGGRRPHEAGQVGRAVEVAEGRQERRRPRARQQVVEHEARLPAHAGKDVVRGTAASQQVDAAVRGRTEDHRPVSEEIEGPAELGKAEARDVAGNDHDRLVAESASVREGIPEPLAEIRSALEQWSLAADGEEVHVRQGGHRRGEAASGEAEQGLRGAQALHAGFRAGSPRENEHAPA
jgi:hypothetical protein